MYKPILLVAGALAVLFSLAIVARQRVQAAPGDMVDVMAGDSGGADPGYVQLLREKYGLDKPLPVRLSPGTRKRTGT